MQNSRTAVFLRILNFAFYVLRLKIVPRGNAPRSSGYQPGALLLSYRTVVIPGFNPKPTGRNTSLNFDTGRIRMTRFGL